MNTNETTTKNAPIEVLRDGSMKASIWKNVSEKGAFYSVRITRTYQDADGNYHDSDRFSGAELLRAARLANLAYDFTVDRRAADRSDVPDPA